MSALKRTVLVVDDEPAILEIVQAILEDEAYSVTVTDRCHSVETLIHRTLPTVILLDVLLAECDGRTLAKHLKSQEETKHIPIILFSAHVNAEALHACGADDFLAKPFEIDALVRKVDRYARRA